MRRSLMTLVVAALAVTAQVAGSLATEPVRLIFDTDIGNDVDDVLALGVIHALQSRGQCELLSVTITKDNPLAAELVDAVNTFYGRGEIPIGVVHSGITPEDGKFLKLARAKDHGVLRYPHDLDGAQAPSAVTVLRRTLSQQPDGSVVIVQVGFSTNLAQLLASPADEISPWEGVELVRRKVRLLSVMAGNFASNPDPPRPLEYNVINDVPAFDRLMRDWPTPIVLSGFEIGIAVPYPAVSIERDYGYVAHHPLAEAYRLYEPPPHNRPTWDLTSVLYAVFPDRGYFDLSPPGRVSTEQDGFTRWEACDDGPHRYLQLTALQAARVTEALVQLSSQPPRP